MWRLEIADSLCNIWFSWKNRSRWSRCNDVQPRKESSMKASPGLLSWMLLLAELKSIMGVDVPRASAIKQNKSNHRNGLRVEPCPGPKRGTASEFWLLVLKHCIVLILWHIVVVYFPERMGTGCYWRCCQVAIVRMFLGSFHCIGYMPVVGPACRKGR